MNAPLAAVRDGTPKLVRYFPICLLLMFGSEQGAKAALSGDEALALMKANDAQFDNVLIEYDYTKYEQVRREEPKAIDAKLQVDESIDPSTVPSEKELWDLYRIYVFPNADKPPGPVPEEK